MAKKAKSSSKAKTGKRRKVDTVVVEIVRNGAHLNMNDPFGEWPDSIPKDPIDPAVEQRFMDWQKRGEDRRRQALNDLKNSVQKAPRAASAAPSGTTPKPPATTKPATATPFEGLASGAPTTAPASKPPLIPPPSKAPPSRPAADASNPFGSL